MHTTTHLPPVPDALAQLRRWEARLINIGHARHPWAAALADTVRAAWIADGGEVGEVVSWPERAASWLRPARRLASGGADAWILVADPPDREPLTRRLAAEPTWQPDRTLALSEGARPMGIDAPHVVTHATPAGPMTLAATDVGLVVCSFEDPDKIGSRLAEREVPNTASPRALAHLELARTELDRYWAGDLRRFTVPVDLRLAGSFDRTVLTALESVGYGATTSYGRIAGGMGLPPVDSRKVGQALGRNPVLVVVPCHRVVGADGALVGYAGGLPTKRRLLDLESEEPRLDLDLFG